MWDACSSSTGIDGWQAALPSFEQGEKIATRVAIEKAFNASLDGVPGLFAGAADLTGNTGTKLTDQQAQSFDHPGGRQMYYGVHEHGWDRRWSEWPFTAASFRRVAPSSSSSTTCAPRSGLASLSQAKVVFVWTHDSVGVGEDGPTHQPVEHLATLRAIPGLQVIRPADANETVAAWKAAVAHDGPTALVLSRQAITVCTDGSAVEPGAAVIRDADNAQVVLVGTGSEVSVCVTAAEQLAAAGIGAAVVSMPSWDRFAAQSGSYQDSVLPAGLPSPLRRGRGDVRLGALRRRVDRHRPLRRQRARRRRHGQAGHQRRQRRGCGHPAGSEQGVIMDRLAHLYHEFGQSPWLDNLKRGYITSGQLQRLVDKGIRGLTSNPTIFQKAIQGSPDYDEQFRTLVAANRPIIDDYWSIVLADINGAELLVVVG